MLRSGLVTNTGWNLVGAVFNQGSTLALGIFVAKALGRDSYGAFAFLQGTLATLITISQTGMAFVATKFVGEFRSTQKERAGRVMAISITIGAITGLLVASIAFGAADFVASRVARQSQLAALLHFASAAVFCSVVSGVLTAGLAGLAKFRTIAVTGMIAGTAYLALGTAGTIGWQLRGVALAISLSAALQMGVVWIALRRETARMGIPVALGGIDAIKAERVVLQHTALPALIIGFVNMSGIWLSMAILVRQSNGITQLALFNSANSFRILVSFIPAVINSVGFPLLSNRKGEADAAGYRRVFRANVAAVVGAAFCGAIVVGAAGPWILRVFGRSFVAGYPVLLILMLVCVLEAIVLSMHQVVQTHGSLWTNVLCFALPREITCIVMALVLTPLYGAVGLAIAYVIAYSVAVVSVLIVFARMGHHALAP
jgi:O-antigen/teichoic acid export membrane protein